MELAPEYSEQTPSPQTMVDILRGSWLSEFPKSMGLRAGHLPHFEGDPRVNWANSVLPGGMKGKSVLELGPLEAYHTWQVQQLGAAHVTSVESNNISFLKCLIVKELLQLNARFLYGDAIKFLESNDRRFDLCWASGLLYHQTDPLYLLSLMQGVADTLFIWTHYFEANVILTNPGLAPFFDNSRDSSAERLGFRARYFYRNYRQIKDGVFSGGADEFSYWMAKEDILGFLRHVGFKTITMGIDHLQNPNGPAMFFL